MAKATTRAGRTPDTQTTQSALPKGKNYLFIIGVDKYDSLPQLYNAVKDAKDVCEVLTKNYQFANKGEQCFTLFDKDATQKNIFNKLDFLANTITDQDNLLVYYSGHGEFKSNIDEGFWIPSDGEIGNIGSFIPFSVLIRYIKAIKSFHTFIIADSCYSGTLFTDRGSTDAKAYLESIPSRWLLTAGRNEVVADGRPGDNSPFADAVLYRLRNNQEERLRVSDFCNFIITDVANNADQVPRGASLHGVGDRGGEFMFRLKAVADKVYADNLIVKPTETSRGTPIAEETPEPVSQPVLEAASQPIHTLGDLQKRLKKLIAADEFEKAFEILSDAVNEDATVANTLISLQGQYNGIRKQQNQGTVSDDFAARTFNRIRVALTDITDKLELDDLNAGYLQPEPGNNVGNVMNNISALERQGLENQIQILTQKLNFLREQQAISSDASQKFTLKMQIEEAEKQIQDAKSKLGIS